MPTLQQRRQQIIDARQAQSDTQYQHASYLMATRLLTLEIFNKSQHIACYLSHKKEVDTQYLIEQIRQLGKSCYLPNIASNKQLSYRPYDSNTTLIKNRYHFLEPDPSIQNTISTTQLDLVIVPLVIFDQQCTRIGWGHGHYDRSFSFLNEVARPSKPYLLGLAYELQKQSSLKRESWDIPLDAVITESTIYYPTEKK